MLGIPLPPEIRNKIYRLVLIYRSRKRTLVQPSLTRVSKETRREALPIYYGENSFILAIPPPRRGDRSQDHYYRLIKMFRVFAAGGTGTPGTSWLRFLRTVVVVCRDVTPALYDEQGPRIENHMLGFCCQPLPAPDDGSDEPGYGDSTNLVKEACALGEEYGQDVDEQDTDEQVTDEQQTDDEDTDQEDPVMRSVRIDDDAVDWKDKVAVDSAFNTACKGARSWQWEDLAEHIPVRRVSDVLYMVAKECPEAMELVDVFWSTPSPVRRSP